VLSEAGAFPQMSSEEGLWWMVRSAISKQTLAWIIVFETVILLCSLGGPTLIWFLSRLLGQTVAAGIETFDRSLLGVDVEIGSIYPSIMYGILDVQGLVVKNPEGGKYDSEYLLQAKKVHIDIDMLRLFCSRFKHVKVEKLEFRDVDVIYEKGLKSSNIQDVLNFLAGDGKKDPEAPPEATKAVKSVPKDEAEAEAETATPTKSDVEVTLHEVKIENVGARAQMKLLGGRGIRVAIADISYRDFTEDVGTSAMDDVIVLLLKSVLKSVLANVIGKKYGDRCM